MASPIQANLRQPLTIDKGPGLVITAQAETQIDSASQPTSVVPGEEGATAELAKAAQNPIANLISVPFQDNTVFGVGPQGERTLNVLNIQPMIPVPLSKDLLLIASTIVPVINQPTSPTGRESLFGMGDINPQFYFSPRVRSKVA